MSRALTLSTACKAVCTVVSDIGFAAGWHVRLRAAELLIAHLADNQVQVMVVRGIAYGRLATMRLGGAPFPTTDAELAHFREQVGPAMLTLGADSAHAVLVVDGKLVVELASWMDHDDPGVLLEPFVADLPAEPREHIVIEGLAYGATIVYEPVPAASLAPLNRTYEQMARLLATNAAPRVRWLLDSPHTRKERSA